MTTSHDAQGESFFLNLRFMLIICVFAGNALEPLTSSLHIAEQWFRWIFMFHIPLFVLVTGYFAKSSLTGSAGRKVLLQIGMQYLIFQSLYSVLDVALFHVPRIHHSFFAPYLLLWFLASHICWRLLMLALQGVPPVLQLGISVLLGILVGYLPVEGIWLSVCRTFVFFPYFIAGYHLNYADVRRFFTVPVRVTAGAVSVLLLVLAGTSYFGIPAGWLYGSMTYGELGHAEWYAGIYRIGMYGVQLLASMAFLSFVPAITGRITEMGRRTLYVFLLHGLIVRTVVAKGVYEYIHNPAEVILIVVCAAGLCCLLTMPWVRAATRPLIEPQVDWMLKPAPYPFR
ncbi:acyltransferase family protein [Paenibacillus farraposensis]|uniref:Acyltransferase family protein n=1 Tax=Paenibacillus farraposensis TaxID=2807095 RepID=A0ABW4DE72_9BACL|nr:fucose 4-O-acetylase [Paenibacillus farraposensis]MCC3378862.1 fucose 4-O-acetylase [Paenibacillus farraposensis]